MNDKPHIPRTDVAGGSGHDAKRVDNSNAGIVAPDIDGLVCEQCGERMVGKGEIATITIIGNRFCIPMKLRRRVCIRCYEIAVDRIKNILGKYTPKTDDVEPEEV